MMRGVIHFFEQCVQLAKICFVISLICFAPQFLFREPKKNIPSLFQQTPQGELKLGVENISREYLKQVLSIEDNIGLVTQLEVVHENIALLRHKEISVFKVFCPDEPEVIDKFDAEDAVTDVHVIKKDGFGALLKDIKLLLVDLQDVGIGNMACIRMLFQTLNVAAREAIPVMILDRPNILGNKIEGSLLQPSELDAQVPLRYGMTVGELAQYYNVNALSGRISLHIVPMSNYDRKNIIAQKQDIAHVACESVFCSLLDQVKPIDVGLGTEFAYRCISLPKSVEFQDQKWYQLKIILRDFGIESAICRYHSKQKNEFCRGLRLHIKDVQEVDSFKVMLTVLEFFKRSGVVLHFTNEFDDLMGTTLVRNYIQGKVSKRALAEHVNRGLEDFYRKAFGAFMYHPLPQVVLV